MKRTLAIQNLFWHLCRVHCFDSEGTVWWFYLWPTALNNTKHKLISTGYTCH